MGSGASTSPSIVYDEKFLKRSAESFREWYRKNNVDVSSSVNAQIPQRNLIDSEAKDGSFSYSVHSTESRKQMPNRRETKTDDELIAFMKQFLLDNNLKIVPATVEQFPEVDDNDRSCPSEEIRGPSHTNSSSNHSHRATGAYDKVQKAKSQETFVDSIYVKEWLSKSESDDLLNEMSKIGERQRPKGEHGLSNASKVKSKYPLWTTYFGIPRTLDGAYPLDRWGSYHESWLRVKDAPPQIVKVCDRINQYFALQGSYQSRQFVYFSFLFFI